MSEPPSMPVLAMAKAVTSHEISFIMKRMPTPRRKSAGEGDLLRQPSSKQLMHGELWLEGCCHFKKTAVELNSGQSLVSAEVAWYELCLYNKTKMGGRKRTISLVAGDVVRIPPQPPHARALDVWLHCWLPPSMLLAGD